MLREDIGQVIRRKREARLMSVTELAQVAGVTDRTIYSLEAGTTQPNFKTLRRIAGALDITGDELITEDALYSEAYGEAVEGGR